MRVALLIGTLSTALALTSQPTIRTTQVGTTMRRSVLVTRASPEDPQAQSGARVRSGHDLVAATPLPSLAVIFSPALLLAFTLFLSTAGVGVAAAASGTAATTITFSEIMAKASKRAFSGGLAGSIAGVIQVCALMWMRTTMNYQYRYGASTKEAMKALYAQGGIGRFYQGLPYALMQTPLARFGDTAANTGVLAIFQYSDTNIPLWAQTAVASAAGSTWRILITPIDTLKTTMQVEGKAAMSQIAQKVKDKGPLMLYQGAIANAIANFVGSYPWYFTFNMLQKLIPQAPAGVIYLKLLRNALCGFGATCVSDVCSNFIRVLKTTVQTSPTKITYQEAAQQIIDKDGVAGLFARGLGTRLLTNGLQASLFSVLWKLFEDMFSK